jgi:two-component system cell cycle response regulator DivK
MGDGAQHLGNLMKTILIVEDNEKNMKLARDILRAKGYATLEAVNGLDGVALALAHKPDLVLMDIQLPDINGIEAFERIRANAGTARVPVIAFTASVTTGDRSRIGDAGFDGFLGKPINLKEFVETVKRLAGEPSP